LSTDHPVLVVLAHPAIRTSRVNRRLADAVRDLDGVTVHDLYESYPDFDIDAAHEQALLASHDVVVLQHPLYWYSTPAILKEWQDLVLEHGWAYGRDGRALVGKILLTATTTGGGEASYTDDGSNRFSVRQLLAPIEQTARLCGMDYPPPFVVHETHRLDPAAIQCHARDYRRVLSALRDGALDLRAARGMPRINLDLDALIGDGDAR
jgi:glutathione-regulated potassium-efflux system ancillary protein KefG